MTALLDAVPSTTEADLFDIGGLEVSLVGGLPCEEVTRRCGLAHRAGEVCHRALAFYLHDLHARRLYQALGFSSAVHFAQNRLGMCRARAHELLATGARLAELPKLDEAFARGELSWSKVRRVARVATADTEQAWIERAREASQQEVEALVSVVRAGDPPPKLDQGLPRTRFVLRLSVDALQHEMFERAREKLQAELGAGRVSDEALLAELMRLFLASNADGSVPGRKKTDGSLFRVPVDDEVADQEEARSDAAVTGRLRRRVLAREGHRCASCGSRRSLMIHHVVWASRGGPTVPVNLVTLCARCHALVHDELLFVSGVPGRWELRDRSGRELGDRIPERGVRLRTDSTMVESVPRRGDGVAVLNSVDDVPDQIDVAWWRRHEHLFEWTGPGVGIRLRGTPQLHSVWNVSPSGRSIRS